MVFHLSWALGVPVLFCLILGCFDGFNPIEDGIPGAGRKWAILFESKMRSSSSDFRSLIGYVLSGYVARAFSMWYSRRKNYAAFCGTTRNLILNLSAAMPLAGPAGLLDAEKTAKLRSDLGRWAVCKHGIVEPWLRH